MDGICPTCGARLELSKSNFNRGKFRRCKPCYNKQHLKEWYAKNKETAIDKAKKYYRKTRKRRLAIAQARRDAMSPEERNKNNREIALKRKYGITLNEYEEKFTEQNGLCFLCGQPAPKGQRLAVDHCHKTDSIRKLLCGVCNRALGFIERDPAWVTRALDYLKGD